MDVNPGHYDERGILNQKDVNFHLCTFRSSLHTFAYEHDIHNIVFFFQQNVVTFLLCYYLFRQACHVKRATQQTRTTQVTDAHIHYDDKDMNFLFFCTEIVSFLDNFEKMHTYHEHTSFMLIFKKTVKMFFV